MTVHNLSENNSLINHFVAELRDIAIQNDSLRFRRNIERIGEAMSYEISKTLSYSPKKIQTPLGTATVSLSDEKIVLATIFRAGIPFHQGFLHFFDRAENAFVSAFRHYDESHSGFDIVIEYLSSPSIEGKTLILIDPMLATGGSLAAAYRSLLKRGKPGKLHIASVIAAKPGIETVQKELPADAILWTAAIDPALDENAYIIPGLGDAGDLAYGTKN